MTLFAKPDSDTCVLVLLRHGATEINVARPYRLQGRRTDLPLCEVGRKQAESAGRFLASAPLERVLCSPLRRARETAQAVARPHGIAVEPCEAITECDVGRWEGMAWEHIQRQDAEAYRAFMADPSTTGYAGGENFTDVRNRVVPAVERLLDDSLGTTLALVGHNTVNRVLLAEQIGVPLRAARRIPQANGGISLVRRRGGQSKLLVLNSIWHLNWDPQLW